MEGEREREREREKVRDRERFCEEEDLCERECKRTCDLETPFRKRWECDCGWRKSYTRVPVAQLVEQGANDPKGSIPREPT